MSLLRSLKNLVLDPPPPYVFELSEAGVAYSANGQQGFAEFPPKTLLASPIEDNILGADAASSTLTKIVGGNSRKARPAAVLLPDHAVRVSLLDFDNFPTNPDEQKSLVRFRVKKTIPFDIESASVNFWVQPGGDKKKADVVAVVVTYEILARYEALMRSTGFYPGEVTPSSLAALELYREPGVAVIARLTGRTLTVMAVEGSKLRLFRCLTMDESTDDELMSVLQPTFAYVEDDLGKQVTKLVTCGFARVPDGITLPVEPLRSRIGAVNGFNAGLLGYLEAVQ
jgi:type IV pilus assembly protein PilM